MFKSTFLLLLLIGVFLINSKLVQVIEIFRHGTRGPLYNIYDWQEQQENMGELLPAGMRQHYELGKQLRKEYIEELEFLSENYDPTKFSIYSTNKNRTIQSAQAQLLGLYPFSYGPELIKDIDNSYYLPPDPSAVWEQLENQEALPNQYDPIPVHTVQKEDLFLSSKCPNKQKFFEQNKHIIQEIYDQVQNLYQPLFKKCSQIFQQDFTNTNQLWDLYDNLYSTISQERKLPEELSQKDLDLLKLAADFEWNITYGTGEYNRIQSSSVFDFIIDIFQNYIKSDQSTNNIKWTMLSGHDTNLIIILSALNYMDLNCTLYQLLPDIYKEKPKICLETPQYASSLIFELHQQYIFSQNDNNNYKYYIKMKYEGNYLPLNLIESCQNEQNIYECQFDNFIQNIQNKSENPHLECGFIEIEQPQDLYTKTIIDMENKSGKDLLLMLLCVISIAISIFLLLTYQKKEQIKIKKQLLQENIDILD
ncbi:hypothetical protein PPERSA_12992 [Pseudocohnilembus persalinus]|uniref:Histidine phosphatase superfamily, clade-2 n=1 Tax=Pseudocohnilembus persalinus TaxID=266149 RepID=A0A0V0R1W2_PSEPJ|nr:hypothetical protein PPERSA_12992 [Pseudocohnilembus persalinus]|eukprot:KRX08511.1 hypothetical protein PPERSA_12992 [Pseudocohnilembus persalinus]